MKKSKLKECPICQEKIYLRGFVTHLKSHQGNFHLSNHKRRFNSFYKTIEYGKKVALICPECKEKFALYASQIVNKWVQYNIYHNTTVELKDWFKTAKIFHSNKCKAKYNFSHKKKINSDSNYYSKWWLSDPAYQYLDDEEKAKFETYSDQQKRIVLRDMENGEGFPEFA